MRRTFNLPVATSVAVLLGIFYSLKVTVGIRRYNLTAVEIDELLRKHGLIPDVIQTAPKNVLQVTYFPTLVKFGNEINATETDVEPPLMEWPADSEYQYTLIMTDPDVPNRTTPYEKEWQNWIVVNIPGCKFTDGEVLTEYIPPLPDQIYGGVHRIVFLAYRQPLLDIIFKEPELGEEHFGAGNMKLEGYWTNERSIGRISTKKNYVHYDGTTGLCSMCINSQTTQGYFKEMFLNNTEAMKKNGRNNFDVKEFARNYKLGDIYALNFFLSEKA